ncbi:hypothetical protein PM082_019598 [Marasmius tenuissimus]|nr:hypothetical protein PM082_019598 [Marasmius tenuissimus]
MFSREDQTTLCNAPEAASESSQTTDSPCSLTQGFLRRLFAFPRFSVRIVLALEPHKPRSWRTWRNPNAAVNPAPCSPNGIGCCLGLAQTYPNKSGFLAQPRTVPAPTRISGLPAEITEILGRLIRYDAHEFDRVMYNKPEFGPKRKTLSPKLLIHPACVALRSKGTRIEDATT